MGKYSLDYGFTCPSIDSEISDAKSIIENHFYEILQELNPLMCGLINTPEAKLWVEEATEALYGDLESVFENCRSINEDIRSAADQQIAECVSELEDLESQIKEYENM